MKVIALKTFNDYFITKGNIYVVEETPWLYEPVEFNRYKDMIIICDDGKSRKFQGKDNVYDHKEVKHIHFKDVRELREEKLNQLGIK